MWVNLGCYVTQKRQEIIKMNRELVEWIVQAMMREKPNIEYIVWDDKIKIYVWDRVYKILEVSKLVSLLFIVLSEMHLGFLYLAMLVTPVDSHWKVSIPSKLQIDLADKCQLEWNPSSKFPSWSHQIIEHHKKYL